LLRVARDDRFAGVRRTNCIFLLLVGTLAGCMSPKAFVREGDANSVEITYGGDVARTLPVARDYCARFERVAYLVRHDTELAEYQCVKQ
jgi:hypothetical protein